MKIPFEDIQSAIESEKYIGFCLSCGAETDGVEPDAREYECDECGVESVYGAEEILIMGAYK
jgi:predicted RNA-binding Zn-ribbon protein involved in translation (DUF1610 family)